MTTDLTTVEGRRTALLDMAARRAKPGSGTAQAVRRARTWTLPVPDLRLALTRPFALTGGVATRLYMQERTNPDLDILIAASDAEATAVDLERIGATRLGDHPAGGTRWMLPATLATDLPAPTSGWRELACIAGMNTVDADDAFAPRRLDVLALDAPWVGPALRAPRTSPTGLPVLALPYLALMKLIAGTSGDVDDLARLLGAADAEELDAVRTVAQAYRPVASADLERLIVAGRRQDA